MTKIVLKGRMPGLNELLDAMNKNRHEYNRLKKEQVELCAWQLKKIPPCHKIDLEILWVEPNRRRDKDNIAGGGLKIILDALRAAGVIKNDGWKQIGRITNEFAIDKNDPRVEIVIQEVAP